MTTTSTQGTPCWYELGTSSLDGAIAFYGKLFGWSVNKAPMEGFDYRLASAGGDMVAGMMSNAEQHGAPPHWLLYFQVDDCDAFTAQVAQRGGGTLVPPTDIPNTGRFAVLTDPQGAAFGVLTPLPMDPADGQQGGAFNQEASGHGNWHELMSSDPKAALAFYTELLGWTAGDALDMGPMGTYQLIAFGGRNIGGIMGQGQAPRPAWLPYFGVDDVAGAMATITETGGSILHGPQEVPGPALIAVAMDPQHAAFAIVGPKPGA